MSEKKMIYLSDQNPEHCEENKQILEENGYAVTVFNSGEEAMEAAEQRPPDLFITSMGLGGVLDGLQFVRALRQEVKLKDIPIIMLTGVRRVMHLPFAFEPDPEWFPVDYVVEKPATTEYLLKRVEQALSGATTAV